MQGPDEHGALARDVLDALSASIAVLDAQGTIVAVNEAWIRFARANDARDPRFYLGADYLAVCEKALLQGNDDALQQTVRGLRAVLNGASHQFSIEYPCHSPTEQRWFYLRATRLQDATRPGMVVSHENITQRKRAEQVLASTERTLRLVLEALPVGVWIMDGGGKIVYGNPAGLEIWRGARYVGLDEFGEYKAWRLSSGKPITADEWAGARAIRNGETTLGEEIEIECFDGTHKILLNSALPLLDDTGAVSGAIVVNQDITERKNDEHELRRAKEEVEHASRQLVLALERERELARVDDLTGAINRRHFFELADHELSVATRYRQPLSLLLFDIDHFKRANDVHGHQAGDALLKRAAAVGQEHVRISDIFARYGGDEFVVLLPHATSAEAAVVAERMRAAMAAASVAAGNDAVSMTISIGIADFRGGDTLDGLVRRADEALYRAKNSGRNRFAIADPAT